MEKDAIAELKQAVIQGFPQMPLQLQSELWNSRLTR